MQSITSLVVFLALVGLAAAFGAQFAPGDWYEGLHKPPLTPPNWIFAPVWSILYVAIASSAWLVWRSSDVLSAALVLWGAQLALNAVWSYLFFGLQRPGLALVEIVVLLGLVAATTRWFWSVSLAAGLLFVPYLAWVSFAVYLNAGFWQLNR